MDYEIANKLDEVGALDESKPAELGPWVNAPLKIVLETVPENGKSKPRAIVYAFNASVVAALAYYAGWEAEETAVWLALSAAVVPFGGLVMATLRTWPRRRS